MLTALNCDIKAFAKCIYESLINLIGKILMWLGFKNLGADRIVCRLARRKKRGADDDA